jgi:hypothetical protein
MLSGIESCAIGDGIVSLEYALLKDAQQIILKDVYHSINAPADYWYGGEQVVEKWLPAVRSALDKKRRKSQLSWLSSLPALNNILPITSK